MDIQAKPLGQPISPLTLQGAPQPMIADTRPTADTAAIPRDSTPNTALPIPPSVTQQGLVGQLMIKSPEDAARTASDGPVQQIERTLKPYGIAMLPGDAPEQPVPRDG